MTAPIAEISADLPCHRCGYDLRAHPQDGKCPECNASVAESRQWAAIPRRPAWRNSDPRWRRRMLAGAWILVLLPLMDALETSGWASSVRVPNVFGFPGAIRTLDETFLCWPGVYQPLIFCTGVVLLFSKERGRRRGRLDWTRRWGVICSYVVSLLSATQVLLLSALVAAGIAALFQSMPPKYQPGVTQFLVDASAAYLRYGPYPKDVAGVVLVASSSITILLACIALFDALRGSGPKRLGAILLAPLAFFSLMNLAQAGRYWLGFSDVTPWDVYSVGVYFRPQVLVSYIADLPTGFMVSQPTLSAFVVEAVKWCIVLAIAVWLSIAQLATWRKRDPAKAEKNVSHR
jgi:hypothetical protein